MVGICKGGSSLSLITIEFNRGNDAISKGLKRQMNQKRLGCKEIGKAIEVERSWHKNP